MRTICVCMHALPPFTASRIHKRSMQILRIVDEAIYQQSRPINVQMLLCMKSHLDSSIVMSICTGRGLSS